MFTFVLLTVLCACTLLQILSSRQVTPATVTAVAIVATPAVSLAHHQEKVKAALCKGFAQHKWSVPYTVKQNLLYLLTQTINKSSLSSYFVSSATSF